MSSKETRTVEKSRMRESRQEHRTYAPNYQYKQTDGHQQRGSHGGPPRNQMPQGGGGGGYSGAGGASAYKSGHMEINSLYSGDSGQLTVNSMNAPNNSTLQCGCENIDCPFCNQMLSIQMSGGQ